MGLPLISKAIQNIVLVMGIIFNYYLSSIEFFSLKFFQYIFALTVLQ